MNIWEWILGIWDSSLFRSSYPIACHLRPVPCNKRSDSVVSSLHGFALSQGWQITIRCSLWHYCGRTNDEYDRIHSQWWKRTLWLLRIGPFNLGEYVTPPLSIKLDCSFEIMENGLAKSLVILITAAVSELIDICMVFLLVASMTHCSLRSEALAIIQCLHTCF